MLGLPVNDGRIIRPVDEPPIAKFVPDWYTSLTEALTRRPELRTQKWQIKSLELQLRAAKSLVHPQLNFVGSYQVNAFGNDLISQQSQISQPFSSAFASLAEADQTGWTAGFQFSMPIGFRAAWSQVRQYEIRIAKAREGLSVQEMEVAQELAVAFQNVAVNYQTAQSYFNRRVATERKLALYEYQYEVGTTTLSFVLTAQSNLASAESELLHEPRQLCGSHHGSQLPPGNAARLPQCDAGRIRLDARSVQGRRAGRLGPEPRNSGQILVHGARGTPAPAGS